MGRPHDERSLKHYRSPDGNLGARSSDLRSARPNEDRYGSNQKRRRYRDKYVWLDLYEQGLAGAWEPARRTAHGAIRRDLGMYRVRAIEPHRGELGRVPPAPRHDTQQ